MAMVERQQLTLAATRDGERPSEFALPPGAETGDESDDDGYLDGFIELHLAVDGVLELLRWGGIGRSPDDLINIDQPLLPPVDGTLANVQLMRCGCGELGCGSLTMTIRRVGSDIEWSDAREGDRTFDIGPFRFDAGQYEAEVRRMHEDRPWETRLDHVARLVGDEFRELRDGRPVSFDFASGGWEDDAVVVSMTEHSPNPRAGQERGPRMSTGGAGYTVAIESDEISEQHLGRFTVGEADEPSEAARIVAQIRSTPLRDWPPYNGESDWG